ncbi:MAG: hypothetical protein ACF8MF_00100 [Phycisphaerales bacterium JB052]
MTMPPAEQTQQDDVRAQVMAQAQAIAGEPPKPQLRSIVCPYCGSVTPDSGRCGSCGGRIDPLSRQATQNQMGPWEIRDERVPFRPGCNYATLVRLIEQSVLTGDAVLRGPSTRQFWMLARHTPGVAHKLGVCHNCQARVKPDAFSCPSCEASFEVERDRQHLGLGPARPLPGQGLPEVLALHAEPASVKPDQHIASTAIASPERMQSAIGAPPAKRDSLDDDARRMLDDANRLVRQWRNRASNDRQHAWAVMIIASCITLAALGYAYWTNGAQNSADSASTPAVASE